MMCDAMAGQQDKTGWRGRALSHEISEAFMPRQIDMIEVIKASAAQRPVRHVKTGGPDHVDGHAKARGEAQNGTGVLWNVGWNKASRMGRNCTFQDCDGDSQAPNGAMRQIAPGV